MDKSSKYEIPWNLITDSFTGSLSPEDQKKLEDWIASDPTNMMKYSELKEIWANDLNDYSYYQLADESKAWVNLNTKLRSGKTNLTRGLFNIKRNHLIRVLSGIAAGFLVIIVTGYFLFANHKIVYKTGMGEERQIVLTDGTEVIMKSLTKINIDRNYNKAARKISLEQGEAKFDVRHLKNQFVVEVGPVFIEDLGTTFYIKKEKEKIDVEVYSGEIAFTVKASKERKVLTAGERIVFGSDGKKLSEIFDIQTGKVSEKSTLKFENTPLYSVIESIQNVSGRKIILPDTTLGYKRLTANLTGVSFENMINIICRSLELEFSVKDSSYILNEKIKN